MFRPGIAEVRLFLKAQVKGLTPGTLVVLGLVWSNGPQPGWRPSKASSGVDDRRTRDAAMTVAGLALHFLCCVAVMV